MQPWQTTELEIVTSHDEVRLAVDKRNGAPGDPVIMWAVVVDGEVYVRAVRGDASPWYRRALDVQHGLLRVGSLAVDVDIEPASSDVSEQLDAAYRQKYGRYAKSIVDSTVTPIARAAGLRLVRSAN